MMGWTYQAARHYKPNGNVDRKAECDELFTWAEGDKQVSVVKSAMVGSVYYAAVRVKNQRTRTQTTEAVVCLTASDRHSAYQFGYKSMGETWGPVEDECPASILRLLTPTEDKYALEWRERCRENLRRKKNRRMLSALPVGTVIEFDCDGETIKARKLDAAYQFKRPWWYDGVNHWENYMIPSNYRIVGTME